MSDRWHPIRLNPPQFAGYYIVGNSETLRVGSARYAPRKGEWTFPHAKILRRLKWFFALLWQPWHGGPITIREAWAAAGSLGKASASTIT